MPFTATDIKTTVWSYIDDAPEDSDLIKAINEAIVTLGERALNWTETEQVAVPGEWYPLPAGLIAIREIADATGKAYRYWRERGGKVSFTDAGTYTIVHTTMPNKIDSLTDPIPVHDAYEASIAHYVAGWLKKRDDDESADGARLLAQAEAEFQRVYTTLLRGRRGPAAWKVE